MTACSPPHRIFKQFFLPVVQSVPGLRPPYGIAASWFAEPTPQMQSRFPNTRSRRFYFHLNAAGTISPASTAREYFHLRSSPVPVPTIPPSELSHSGLLAV